MPAADGNDKLISAKTGDKSVRRFKRTESVCKFNEYIVPDIMAVFIIYCFEAVKIDESQGKSIFFFQCQDFLFQFQKKKAAVAETCDSILI